MHLNEISNFNKPTHKKIAKANKKNCITRRLLNIVPINTLVTIYKLFVNPYIYYYDMVYDQPNNEYFFNTIKRVR